MFQVVRAAGSYVNAYLLPKLEVMGAGCQKKEI